jgi:hypothetical protein
VRRLLVVLSLLPLLALSACGLKVPTHLTIRQTADPCAVLGRARLARIAHARGTATSVPLAGYTRARACRFRADAGTPVIILGTFDSMDLSFDQQVTQATDRFTASKVHRVRLRGAEDAATMVALLNGVRVPVLMTMHDRFVSLALTVSRVPGRGARLDREAMVALLRRS